MKNQHTIPFLNASPYVDFRLRRTGTTDCSPVCPFNVYLKDRYARRREEGGEVEEGGTGKTQKQRRLKHSGCHRPPRRLQDQLAFLSAE